MKFYLLIKLMFDFLKSGIYPFFYSYNLTLFVKHQMFKKLFLLILCF